MPSRCERNEHCLDGSCYLNRCIEKKHGTCHGVREGEICWRVGGLAQSCADTCGFDGVSSAQSDKPYVTPLLFRDKELTLLGPWGFHECYIPGRQAFHPRKMDGEGSQFGHAWAYSVCRLLCPCNPHHVQPLEIYSEVTLLSECVVSITNACFVNGHLQVYPLEKVERSMLKACSEMGKTLYEVEGMEELATKPTCPIVPRTAFIVPVTLQMRSP